MREFSIVSVNVSEDKGVSKRPVESAVLREGHGIVGDAHAGAGPRQVSLLAWEDIQEARARGIDVGPGDLAENITTRGVKLARLPVGTRLLLGEAVLEVTRIGKECVEGCEIMRAVGDCIMPRRGVFARVLRGGVVSRESACGYRIGPGGRG